MQEPDDRLAGDPVWELFPAPPAASRLRHARYSLIVVALAACYRLPAASIALACAAASLREFWEGERLARSIPNKAGGRVCSLLTYAWGAWKLGLNGFLMMFVTIIYYAIAGRIDGGAPALFTAMFLWFVGFSSSAALTAAGMLMALRSGMRVWIGEGANQARTLLMAMLIVAFAFLGLGPWCIWLAGMGPPESESVTIVAVMLISMFGLMIGGSVAILIALDRISRHVVADRPGKFGPKVPAVGYWDDSELF